MNTKNPWQQRVVDLRAAGLRLREIAEETGLSISAVSDLYQGRSGSEGPKGDAALKLDALHKRVMRQQEKRGKS